MDAIHDHPPDGPCLPACPGWAEGALRLFAIRRRYGEMLEACRAATAIEWLDVSPTTQGTELPPYLQDEDLVRVNLIIGRDTPEVLLDEWGVRCSLKFRGQHHDCAFPWPAILGGSLKPPRRPRFDVIQGGRKD
ncbi:MAG TPA: hypothetical protein VIV57_10215 [Anaeromyxobacter sp.]